MGGKTELFFRWAIRPFSRKYIMKWHIQEHRPLKFVWQAKKSLYYDLIEKRKKERNSYNGIIKNLNEHS